MKFTLINQNALLKIHIFTTFPKENENLSSVRLNAEWLRLLSHLAATWSRTWRSWGRVGRPPDSGRWRRRWPGSPSWWPSRSLRLRHGHMFVSLKHRQEEPKVNVGEIKFIQTFSNHLLKPQWFVFVIPVLATRGSEQFTHFNEKKPYFFLKVSVCLYI